VLRQVISDSATAWLWVIWRGRDWLRLQACLVLLRQRPRLRTS
jgi:hypothetical protein